MYGIPNMKLEKHIIDRKINVMNEEGINFVTGVNVGKDVKATKLLKEYDCCGTCLRCQKSARYQCTGQRCKRYLFCSGFSCTDHKKSVGFQSER